MILWLSCACAMGAGAGAISQDEAQLQAPMQFVQFQDVKEMLRLTGGGTRIYLNRGKAPKGYTLPKDMKAPILSSLICEAIDGPITILAITPATATRNQIRSAPTEIWLDLDRDKKFSDSEKFKAQKVGATSVFGPVKVPKRFDSSPDSVYFTSEYAYAVSIAPTGYYAFEVELGGKTHRMGLVDVNVNGFIGERMSGEAIEYGGFGGDYLLADFDGNGKFDVPRSLNLNTLFASELRPVTWTMELPDRAFYHLRFADEGDAVTLTPESGEPAKLTADCEKLALLMDGADGPILTFPQESPVQLPPGFYRMGSVVVMATDSKGGLWSADISFSEERTSLYRLKTGDDQNLKCGGKLKAAVTTSHYYDTHSLSVDLTDSYGNGVSGLAKPDGNQPAVPTLKITDASGKLLASPKFSYG